MNNPTMRHLSWLFLTMLVVVMVVGGGTVLRGTVYYAGDIARLYLPQRIELARALREGQLPWWNSDVGVGYPLLAEGEIAALYPLNWVLCALFAPEISLTLSIILHYVIAAMGMYLFLRRMDLTPPASFLGSVVLSLGGFYIAHLSHLAVLSVAAWLPWMLVLTHMILESPADTAWRKVGLPIALAVVVGLQFLAGHAQISLLGLLALLAYALYLECRRLPHVRWARWLRLGTAMAGGIVLGLAQLLPTLELVGVSQRAGGLDALFFTSYSFHPGLIATYLSPYLLGNPYPEGSIELMGYIGLAPLLLVALALTRVKYGARWFFFSFSCVGLLLSFGRWNPAYPLLRHLPLFSWFRVPARYLYWTSLGGAVLAAMGYDALLCEMRASGGHRTLSVLLTIAVGAVCSLVVWRVSNAPDADALVLFFRWLPLVFVVLPAASIMSVRHIRRWALLVIIPLVLLTDLWAFGLVLRMTYSVTRDQTWVAERPYSLDQLPDPAETLYRTYTKQEIVPALSVQRESYYPNFGLAQRRPSLGMYLPLVPRAYQEAMADLTPQRLDRLNVVYYMIPQLLPVDDESELYDVENPFSALPVDEWLVLSGQSVRSVRITSYTSHSAAKRDGELAAEILLRDARGQQVSVPLRIGIETAEWAYERDDVRTTIAHSMPPVASTWPSRSGFPPREHPGHTYLTQLDLDEPLDLDALMIVPAMHEAFVRIESIELGDGQGNWVSCAHLVGLSDHAIVFRSEDVVIYRNHDAFPRAYTVAQTAVRQDEGGITIPNTLRANDVAPAQTVAYEDMRCGFDTTSTVPVFFILSDLYYPGWQARVDGTEAAILLADGLYRAVALPSGSHRVEFHYRPSTLRWLDIRKAPGS